MSITTDGTGTTDSASEGSHPPHDPLRDQFVNVWGPVILKIARARFRLQDADAFDAVQNVCVLFIAKRDSLPEDLDALARWVASAAWKCCWGIVRKRRPVTGVSDGELDGTSVEPPDEIVADAEAAAIVHRALEAMPQGYKQVLLLLFYAQSAPTYRQIADELGIKVGSVGARRERALKRLKQELLRLGLRPDDGG